MRTWDYHVTFLSHHLADKYHCDDTNHFRPEWYEYYLNDVNIPVYGARILLDPKRKPDLAKYMLWSESVHLTDPSCLIHEPFNFDSHSDIISVKHYIAFHHWELSLTSCNKLGITPPSFPALVIKNLRRRLGKSNMRSIILLECKYTSSETLIMCLVLCLPLPLSLSLVLSPTLSQSQS